MVFSFLLPTRGRPERAKSFIESVLATADKPEDVEFILRIDEDDSSYDDWLNIPQAHIFKGPRINLSQCYLWEEALGDILIMSGDDVRFHTKGWDTKVKESFDKYPDKILLVYGDDGNSENPTHGSLPFIHRNWIKAIGRFLPPYFSGDFTDTWLNEIADALGRKVKVNIYTEHLHPAFGKREQDQTDKDKWEKHFRDDMPQKYLDTADEREKEIHLLREYIQSWKK